MSGRARGLVAAYFADTPSSGASLGQSCGVGSYHLPGTAWGPVVCDRYEVGFSVHQAQQLVHQRQYPEHQVAQHLAVAAHTYLPGAELVLQPTVDALLHRRPLPVAHILGVGWPRVRFAFASCFSSCLNVALLLRGLTSMIGTMSSSLSLDVVGVRSSLPRPTPRSTTRRSRSLVRRRAARPCVGYWLLRLRGRFLTPLDRRRSLTRQHGVRDQRLVRPPSDSASAHEYQIGRHHQQGARLTHSHALHL